MTDDPNRHGQTPLGGKSKRASRRAALSRRWSGYVAMIRTCPHCGFENVERNLFCARCARSLAGIDPEPADSEAAGRELLRYRLISEQRALHRHRVQIQQGGTGAIILGAIFMAVGAWISADFAWQTTVWTLGLALALYGVWKLRTDIVALRNWGIILSAAVIGLLTLFASRSLAEPAHPPAPTIVTTPDTSLAAISTPVAMWEGSVPVYRGNNAHTGQQPGPVPEGAPSLAWRFDTGGTIYASPVIADGRLFISSKSGYLYALDAATGDELWRFQLSDYVVRSTPAVEDDIVYIGAGFNLFALDASTGNEIWRFPMRYAGQSSPLIAGSNVLVTSQEGLMYAVDKATGEQDWSLPTEGLPFGGVATDGTIAIVATDSGTVHCIDIASGRSLWRVRTGGELFASPTLAGSSVIVTSKLGTTMALDLDRGDLLWEVASGGMQPAAVDGQAVYISGTDGAITAVSLITGETQWVYPTGRTVSGAPVLAGDFVIAGTGRNLVALNRESGQPVWNYLALGDIETSPAVIGGFVFISSVNGFLYAISSD